MTAETAALVRPSVIALFDEWMGNDAFVSIEILLHEWEGPAGSPTLYALQYASSICGGTLDWNEGDAGEFFRTLSSKLSSWKKRNMSQIIKRDFNEATFRSELLRDVLLQLLRKIDFTPIHLLADVLQNFDCSGAPTNLVAWHAVADEFAVLAKDRFRITW